MSGTNLTLDVGGGFYESDSLPFSNQRCVNFYPNVPQGQALAPVALFNTEGLRRVAVTNVTLQDANRGGIEFQNKAYFVNNGALYRVDKVVPVTGVPEYSFVRLGTIAGRGRVSMAENGTQILIINSDGVGYIYNPTNTPAITTISDAGFNANGTPQQVTFVDSYFIVTTDAKKAIISAVGDGTSWNSLDFVSAEADPDDIVAPFVYKNQLYLLGTQTGEQYQNIGGAGVPFTRVNGWVIDVGCDAPFSVINVGNIVYWIGSGENQKAAIWAFSGGEPQKISTTAVENKLHELSESELSSVFSFAYSQRGNSFIHFTTANNTFVFNPVTGKWHERESEITNVTGQRTTIPCRITSVVEAYNDLLVGDSQDGRIGIVDSNVYTEYDEPYISYFTTQPLYNKGDSFSLPKIEALCETGVGTFETPDPQLHLSIARDGVLFEDSRSRSLGSTGDRSVRPTWYKNGRISQYGSLKFWISAPVKRRFYAIKMKLKVSTYG